MEISPPLTVSGVPKSDRFGRWMNKLTSPRILASVNFRKSFFFFFEALLRGPGTSTALRRAGRCHQAAWRVAAAATARAARAGPAGEAEGAGQMATEEPCPCGRTLASGDPPAVAAAARAAGGGDGEGGRARRASRRTRRGAARRARGRGRWRRARWACWWWLPGLPIGRRARGPVLSCAERRRASERRHRRDLRDVAAVAALSSTALLVSSRLLEPQWGTKEFFAFMVA